jgi:peptidoglycan/LPS O-acetylase OafA/YrhL
MAILLVVVWHYFGMTFDARPKTALGYAHVLARMTWSGVDLFFVLSGYLISTNLMATRDRPGYFRVFYARRCARILPLYFAFLALHSLVTLPSVNGILGLAGREFDNRLPKWAFFTFTQNFLTATYQRGPDEALSVTWSLAVEEQFYLLLPFLIWVLPNRLVPWVALGCVTSAAFTRCLLLQIAPGAAGLSCYVLLPTRWDSLFLGVLVGWLLASPSRCERLRHRAGLLWGLLLVLSIGMGWMTISARGVIMAPFVTASGYTWIGLFYAVLLMLVLIGEAKVLGSLLRLPGLCRLGALSFGVYLFHEPVRAVIGAMFGGPEAGGRFWLRTAVAVGLTWVLAEASWRWLESPCIQFGRRARHGAVARRSSGWGRAQHWVAAPGIGEG